MANKEISQLTEKTTPVGTDEIEIQETGGGTSKRVTLQNVVDTLASQFDGLADQTLSGTSSASITSIPDTVQRITVMIAGVSLANAVDLELFIGGSSGYTSVYFGGFSQLGTGVTTTEESSSMVIYNAPTTDTIYAVVTLNKLWNAAGGWIMHSLAWDEQATETAISVSRATISGGGELDRVKVQPATGNFDGGAIYINWES